MRSTWAICSELAGTAEAGVAELPDHEVGPEILDLLRAVNLAQAALMHRISALDRRDLAPADGCRSAKAWLIAFGRLTPHTAAAMVGRADVLQQLPAMAAATATGDVSADHLNRIVDLIDQVGIGVVQGVDAILATAATTVTPQHLGQLCERVRAYADPDGPEPDPDAVLGRRGFTLSRLGDMVRIKGQLDPEAGAAVMTALDAIMTAPTPDDTRTAAQRRADALTDLARLPLMADALPTTGGQRPQVGLLITPQALLRQTSRRERHGTDYPGTAFTEPMSDHAGPSEDCDPDLGEACDPDLGEVCDPDLGEVCESDRGESHDPGGAPDANSASGAAAAADLDGTADANVTPAPDVVSEVLAPESDAPEVQAPEVDVASEVDNTPDLDSASDLNGVAGQASPARAPRRPAASGSGHDDPLTAAGYPPLDRGYLDWGGEIATETAQRLCCDSVMYRVIYDPIAGQPLDVGRSYRTAPYSIRRALHARDHGCRWPGCTAPTPWTDAHHVTFWTADGHTAVDDMILLCRWHHTRVHEGHWSIRLDLTTGQVHVTRPDGRPYEIAPAQPWITDRRAA